MLDQISSHAPLRCHPKLIGVIHLPALPGDPHGGTLNYSACYEHAIQDARALLAGGVDGIIIENFGSAPFHKGDQNDPAPPHQLAALSVVATQVRALSNDVQLGINCLRNDARAALGIAAATGADFVRINVLSGAYVTDQGLIEGEAAMVLRYRRQLEAQHVKIFADILVKHAAPLAPLSPTQTALDTWKRGGADALIVTGTGTGAAVSASLLDEVQRAVHAQVPVYIGSGLSMSNLKELAPLASGAIIGTAFKEGGVVSAPVSQARVSALREALDPWWSS